MKTLHTAGLLSLLLVTLCISSTHADAEAKKPNILFLFNDDQDLLLGSLNYLDSVTERVQKEGFTFNQHFATIAICCPARVALLRGQHAHNTNVTYVNAPGGAYDKFQLSGQDKDYLPHWLKEAGYRTEYIGKLMNQYGYYNYNQTPKGWDHFDGLLDPYTYIFNTPVFSANGARPRFYQGQHQTDVIRAKAVDRLKKLLANPDEPWYLTVAPAAPHQQFNSTGRWPTVPATRHQNLFPGLKAPRTPNFNPVNQQKPSWVGEMPLMDEDDIKFSDETYRRRSQALVGTNEMLHELLDTLEAAGQLDNTYVIVSSDHGYHVGQHRVPAGKTLPYREDTHVPFTIRGPGIPKDKSTDLPSNHVDIAPTLLKLTGLPESKWPPFLDGRPLSTYWSSSSDDKAALANPIPETVNIEFWGPALVEKDNGAAHFRNTYKSLRIIGPTYSYLYNHWCTHETELYDTNVDPYELTPLKLAEVPALTNRLNALLLVTKACATASCRNPWATLHPEGNVHTLADALDHKYDKFYAGFPRVAFKLCLNIQLEANEEPFYPPLGDGMGFGQKYRNKAATDGLFKSVSGEAKVQETGWYGDVYQELDVIEKTARDLTDEELEV